MNYQTLFVVSLIILSTLTLILFRSLLTQYTPPSVPYVAETVEFPMLKQVALDRVQEIKKKSNFLTPYNPKVMELVEKAITNANFCPTET
jgi:hypothetical protein